jgi:hypothetical protein
MDGMIWIGYSEIVSHNNAICYDIICTFVRIVIVTNARVINYGSNISAVGVGFGVDPMYLGN